MTLSHSRWDEKAGALCEFARQGKASTARPGPDEISVRKFTAGESLSASNKRPAGAGLLLDMMLVGFEGYFCNLNCFRLQKTRAAKEEPSLERSECEATGERESLSPQ